MQKESKILVHVNCTCTAAANAIFVLLLCQIKCHVLILAGQCVVHFQGRLRVPKGGGKASSQGTSMYMYALPKG